MLSTGVSSVSQTVRCSCRRNKQLRKGYFKVMTEASREVEIKGCFVDGITKKLSEYGKWTVKVAGGERQVVAMPTEEAGLGRMECGKERLLSFHLGM